MKRRGYGGLVCLLVTVLGVVLDQLTKYLVVHNMEVGESVPLLGDKLQLTYVTNYGAAFGILADQRWVFLILSAVTIVLIVGYLLFADNQNRLQLVALSMILAGGIGNMIDRTVLGYVVDFIDVWLFDFPVFNGADSFVCVGAGLLLLTIIRESYAEKAARTEEKAGVEDAAETEDSAEAKKDAGAEESAGKEETTPWN